MAARVSCESILLCNGSVSELAHAHAFDRLSDAEMQGWNDRVLLFVVADCARGREKTRTGTHTHRESDSPHRASHRIEEQKEGKKNKGLGTRRGHKHGRLRLVMVCYIGDDLMV